MWRSPGQLVLLACLVWKKEVEDRAQSQQCLASLGRALFVVGGEEGVKGCSLPWSPLSSCHVLCSW